MQGGSSALAALSAMTAPAALVGACGLLLLGIYNKYSHIVASLRRLNEERREAGIEGSAMGDDPTRSALLTFRVRQIRHECGLMLHRLRSVLFQILSVSTAMTLFLAGSISLGAAALLHLPLGGLAVGLVLAGIASLMVAMVLAATEARFIWYVVNAELKWPDSAAFADTTDSFDPDDQDGLPSSSTASDLRR